MRSVLVQIGPIAITTYGTLLLLAFLIGIWWAIREGRRKGIERDTVLDLAFHVLVGSVVTARLTFVLLNLKEYLPDPLSMLLLTKGGLSFHGGLVGGVLAGLVFARRRKVSFWALADLAAPALAVGYAIARIGCFLNGCCYGAPTHLPWAIRFYDPELGQWTPPSHPVQLYSSLGSLAILAALLGLRRRLKLEGALFLAYVALYALLRFGAEHFRKGVTSELLFDSITQAQAASIAALFLAGSLAWRRRRTSPAERQLRRRTPSGPNGGVGSPKGASSPEGGGFIP